MADKNVFEDLQKLAGDAFGALNALGSNVKGEIEALVRRQVDAVVSKTNMVSREEFEVVRDMAQKARLENEALKTRLTLLEERLSPPTGD